MEKSTKYGIVAVVIIVIIIVIVAAVMLSGDDDDESEEDTGDTYYFYMDGFGDDYDGWYTATGEDAVSAYEDAMEGSGLSVTVSDGWVTVDGYEASTDIDDEGNYSGYGISIYEYISTDVDNYYSGYFVAGPGLEDVVSNIVYISYGEYYMDGTTWDTTYSVTPESNEEVGTSGPFTDEGYEPLSYDTYYFYIDGLGDEYDGWYSASGDDAVSVFEDLMEDAGISVTVSGGWVTFDDYDASTDVDEEGNYSGYGVSIYEYISTDADNYYSGYFVAGPGLEDAASNIVYISYGEYYMDGTTWETIYYVSPYENEDIALGGPFAA